MLTVLPKIRPALEPDFVPAALWNRAYRDLVARDAGARAFAFALVRPDGTTMLHRDRVLAAGHPSAGLTLRYAERLLKFLLWQKGATRVLVAGADEITRALTDIYSATGPRAFDQSFMGRGIYRNAFTVEACSFAALPAPHDPELSIDRSLEGCRIGFDLGGSERKVVALIDGRVVHAERLPWAPYFETDPAYHIAKVQEALLRAAAHLPRVDAIGGSAAGVYVNDEVRVASLFRGVSEESFERHIRGMFIALRERWGRVPFRIVNDGEVTALAGAQLLRGPVLGTSFGTSQAAGYVTAQGNLTTWLNELAFAPFDYGPHAARDEWSGDCGCGVQYFSRQGVQRLAARAGIAFNADEPAELTSAVLAALQRGDAPALAVYETIGVCFGYAVAHYHEFYDSRHVLLLGGVATAPGGEVILSRAAEVLHAEFPDLAQQIRFHSPNEANRSHGQAIAAASLAPFSKNVISLAP